MFVTDHALYGGSIVGLPLALMGAPLEIVVPIASLAGIMEAWPDIAPVRVNDPEAERYFWLFGYCWPTYGYWHFTNRGPVGALHRIIDDWMHDEKGKWVWPRAVIGWLVSANLILAWVNVLT